MFIIIIQKYYYHYQYCYYNNSHLHCFYILLVDCIIIMYHHPHNNYQARALRALGLLLADGTPTVGGGRLFDWSAGFFYGNSCNSGTESRKIVPNVGN